MSIEDFFGVVQDAKQKKDVQGYLNMNFLELLGALSMIDYEWVDNFIKNKNEKFLDVLNLQNQVIKLEQELISGFHTDTVEKRDKLLKMKAYLNCEKLVLVNDFKLESLKVTDKSKLSEEQRFICNEREYQYSKSIYEKKKKSKRR